MGGWYSKPVALIISTLFFLFLRVHSCVIRQNHNKVVYVNRYTKSRIHNIVLYKQVSHCISYTSAKRVKDFLRNNRSISSKLGIYPYEMRKLCRKSVLYTKNTLRTKKR